LRVMEDLSVPRRILHPVRRRQLLNHGNGSLVERQSVASL